MDFIWVLLEIAVKVLKNETGKKLRCCCEIIQHIIMLSLYIPMPQINFSPIRSDAYDKYLITTGNIYINNDMVTSEKSHVITNYMYKI